MKRLVVISVAALALLIGTGLAASAQTPSNQGGGCGGTGVEVDGSYDYSATPVFGLVAQKLGLAPGDLAAELKAGKSVAGLAADRGVNLEDLVKVVEAPMDEMAQVMSKYGYMTQAQIDAMKERRGTVLRQALEQKGGFPGMMGGTGAGTGCSGGTVDGPAGMMGGPGGMMGGQRGFSGMMRGFSVS